MTIFGAVASPYERLDNNIVPPPVVQLGRPAAKLRARGSQKMPSL
jgi:hypothetical protein